MYDWETLNPGAMEIIVKGLNLPCGAIVQVEQLKLWWFHGFATALWRLCHDVTEEWSFGTC